MSLCIGKKDRWQSRLGQLRELSEVSLATVKKMKMRCRSIGHDDDDRRRCVEKRNESVVGISRADESCLENPAERVSVAVCCALEQDVWEHSRRMRER